MTSSIDNAIPDTVTNRENTIAFAVLFVVVVAAYVVFATWMPMAYIWATYENLIGEWTQVYLFAFAATVAIIIAFRGDADRWFFAFLGVSCAYVVLEEISWGQQVFGWASPAFFEDHNIQGETNVHNLLTGPVSSAVKDAIEVALASILVIYGALYPVCVHFGSQWALRIQMLGLVVPPMYLAPFFFCAAYLELQPFSVNEAELAELLVGIAFLGLTLHYAAARRRKGTLPVQLLAIGLSLMLAVATTGLMLSLPNSNHRLQFRIDAGIDKFAERYERREQWQLAANLYASRLERHPDSTATLRKLALVERRAGNRQAFHEALNRALEIDQALQEAEPWRSSTQRSLYRTYRALRQHRPARHHADRAIELDVERLAKNPQDADAHYSLGKTYTLIGARDKAQINYERALEIRPQSKSFHDAYAFSGR